MTSKLPDFNFVVMGRPITQDIRRLMAFVLPPGAVLIGIIDDNLHYGVDGKQMSCRLASEGHFEVSTPGARARRSAAPRGPEIR